MVPLTHSQAFKLTSPEEGVWFDLDGDGAIERIAWTAPGSQLAFLAIDRNSNGIIDNGTELLGGVTMPGAHNGFDASIALLRELGGERAGSVRAGDQLYPRLLLWEDRNHNGSSEPDELHPAQEVLTQIGLGYEDHRRRDGHGNLFRFKGWVEIRTEVPAQGPERDPGKQQVRQRDVYRWTAGRPRRDAADSA